MPNFLDHYAFPAGIRGKTLIELIVVISISSILATAAFYRFTGNADAVQKNSAAKVVLTDLRYAKEMAVAAGKSVELRVTPAKNSYRIIWAGSGVALKRPIGGGDLERTFGTGEFSSVRITSTQLINGSLVLKPGGIPFTGGSEIKAKQQILSINSAINIYIHPVTGRLVSETS